LGTPYRLPNAQPQRSAIRPTGLVPERVSWAARSMNKASAAPAMSAGASKHSRLLPWRLPALSDFYWAISWAGPRRVQQMGLLKRRSVIAIIGVTALVEQPGAVQPAWAQSGGQAVAFIKSANDHVVAIVNSSDPPEQKRRQLQLVVDSTVDLDDLGRFCLGRFWRIATAEQQAQYMDLFKDLLVIK